jgi:hypothetical protein
MCHCKRSVKIHVKICERNIRNLVRIWNALSLSISCNWQVSLAYLMLIYFFKFKLEHEIFLLLLFDCILYIIYCTLYIVRYIYYTEFKYNGLALYSNTTPMYYSNTMNKLLESTLHFYILNPRLHWQWLWDNNPSSFLQACPFKYLIEHECVKNYISLYMNVLKITNGVLWWILC